MWFKVKDAYKYIKYGKKILRFSIRGKIINQNEIYNPANPLIFI